MKELLNLSELENKIEYALGVIRPYLEKDGGGVVFVKFEESTKTCLIRFTGNCETCALSVLTLRAGVEKTLIYFVPEIRRVERVK